MTANELIATMTDRIARDFDPLCIVLFGSHARGDAQPDSDIDLLVVLLRWAG
jgi:predicted nucleotidyltransferase